MKFRKKPVVIDAILWTGYNHTQSEVFVGEELAQGVYEMATPECGNGWTAGSYSNSAKIIKTLEGNMRCQPGDWIIRGVNGEFYPCKPDIFEKTYEKVEEST